jgi:hypothetical protein
MDSVDEFNDSNAQRQSIVIRGDREAALSTASKIHFRKPTLFVLHPHNQELVF